MQELNNSSSESAQQFRNLQTELRERWGGIEDFDSGDCDIIIIPSLSLDQKEMQKVEGVYHYEERHLFSLIRARQPPAAQAAAALLIGFRPEGARQHSPGQRPGYESA